ncbi:MAG: ABC transporter permease [Planctomycetales bacterium]
MNNSPRHLSEWQRFLLPVWTLTAREIVRFFRQRTRIVGALVQPILFWILFGAGLHGSFQPPPWAPSTMTYQEYFFPGVAVMIVMFTAIFSTISIIEDRREGFLQGVLVAPVPRLAIVLGKICGGSALAIIQAGLFLLLAPFMGISFSILSWIGMLLFLSLIAFALTALGFLIAWPLDSTQGFHAVMSVFLMPLWLLSGAFFPPAEQGWLMWIMRLNPLSYGVAGLRRILYFSHHIPRSWNFPGLWFCTLITLLFAVLCIAIATRLAESRSVRNAR